MSINTFAIIVGISEYQSPIFSSLPAARADAHQMAQSLVNWGIPESQILLMSTPFETMETLRSHLQKLATRETPFQLLFYFCGHGYRTQGTDPKSYLVFSDTQIIEENDCINGLGLEELPHTFGHLNITNLYLFIDACHLRFNSIKHPELIKKKSLFFLLSSGIEASFESVEHNYGYFTDALMKALVKIRQSDRSPDSLVQSIQEELRNKKLPPLEMYNIGTHHIDFLPQIFSYVENGHLVRQHVIAELQDLQVLYRNKSLCLIGPEGSGKTTLALQLASNLLQCFWIPLDQSIPTLKGQLTQSLFDSQLLHCSGSSISLEECLDFLKAEMPDALLIFDEVRENDSKRVKEILDLFAERSLRIFFLSRRSYLDDLKEKLQNHLMEYHLPALFYEETEIWVRDTHPAIEGLVKLYYVLSKGNIGNLKRLLNNSDNPDPDPKELQEIEKAIAAIYCCGSFINEELFRKTFNLEVKTLTFLKKFDLIYQEEGCWHPHDILIEIAESKELQLDRDATIAYWENQFNELPHHFESAQNLVLTMKCFGYEPKLDAKLKAAFQVLDHHPSKSLNVLKDGAALFSHSQITPSSLFLAEALIERQEFNLAKGLLMTSSSSSNLEQQSRIIYSQLLWRAGLFSRCIEETTWLINTLGSLPEKVWIHMYRGASHFFLGNWEEAKKDFFLINNHIKQPKYVGWARCLLGTITGIRGIDFEKSKKLIESGIQILTLEDDVEGTWIGWNNIGEMMWKAGEWKSSAYFLQKALEIAESINNSNALLETLRNLLQLEFRIPHPNRLKMNSLLDRIETTLGMSNEVFELLQLYNTLSTIYFYLGDYPRSRSYLKKAIPLTTQSKEYHIYTLANLSLHFKAAHQEVKSNFYFLQARTLALEGNNHFAIRQIESDFNRPLAY